MATLDNLSESSCGSFCILLRLLLYICLFGTLLRSPSTNILSVIHMVWFVSSSSTFSYDILSCLHHHQVELRSRIFELNSMMLSSVTVHIYPEYFSGYCSEVYKHRICEDPGVLICQKSSERILRQSPDATRS